MTTFKKDVKKENTEMTGTQEVFKIDDSINITSIESKVSTKLEKSEWNRLVRVKITCLDPSKQKLKGETFWVGNVKKHVRKYVKYNTPYHVPAIILEMMKTRTFTQYKEEKRNGHTISIPTQQPMFSIEYLPDLSAKELDVIKKRQITQQELGDG